MAKDALLTYCASTLRQAREQCALTRKAVAEALHLHPASVRDFELACYWLAPPTIFAYARLVHVPYRSLLPLDPEALTVEPDSLEAQILLLIRQRPPGAQEALFHLLAWEAALLPCPLHTLSHNATF